MSAYELGKALRNQKGSALVGVVALAIILSIGAITYAALVRNAGTNELMAYYDAKAYYVAEQGARIGDNYLSAVTDWPTTTSTVTLNPAPLKISDYGDIECEVTVTINHADSDHVASIVSTATTSRLPYNKVVALKVPGKNHKPVVLFLEDGANFPDQNNAGGLQRGGLFVGPVHFNSPIMLSKRSFILPPGESGDVQAQGFRFQGDVSVYYDLDTWNDIKKLSNWHTGFGKSSTSGNDYSTGVAVNIKGEKYKNTSNTEVNTYNNNNEPTAKDLDLVFKGEFKTTTEKRELVPNFANAKYLGDHTNASDGAEVEIKFGSDATGLYYQVGTSAGKNYYTGETIIYAGSEDRAKSYHVRIKGGNSATAGNILKGKVTVVTDSAKNRDIILDMKEYKYDPNVSEYSGRSYMTYKPDGTGTIDIDEKPNEGQDIYMFKADVDGNEGYDMASKNKDDIFAFYSGHNIIVETGETSKTFKNTQNASVTRNVTNNAIITAQLFAPKGTIKNRISSTNTSKPNAKIHVIGSIMMKDWSNTFANDEYDPKKNKYNTTTEETLMQGNLRAYFDKRMNDGMMGPGLGYGVNGKISIGRGPAGGGSYKWKVTNVPKS